MGALDGIRVLDLSQGAAGPTCGMILGDHGAEVTKVEPLDGEWGRGLGPPFWNGTATAAVGMNRNKHSLALDLKRAEGKDIVLRLVERCDVLLESFRPGVMERLGLGYEALRGRSPRLVYCAITAFGQSGPWRDRPGVDGVLQAMSGLMSVTGLDGAEPVKVGVPAADMSAALQATLGILLALFVRERTGRGQRVDVSLLDTLLAFQLVPITMFLQSREQPARLGSAAPYSAPNEAYRTADGAIQVAAYTPERWPTLCQMLDRPELATDPRFASNADRVTNRRLLREELEQTFRMRGTDEWLALLEGADLLCAPLLDYPTLLAEPQVAENQMLVELHHPLGTARTVGIPVKLADTPGSVRLPAPLVGDNSVCVLRDLGYADDAIRALLDSGAVAARDAA